LVVSKAKKTITARPVQSPPRDEPRVLPLGFGSIFGLLAFCSLCGVAFISPYLFSGFWPSSYEYWPQALFLALTAVTCVLLALEPKSKIKNQRSKTGVLLALFLSWCVLSLCVTVYLHDSLLEIARVTGVVAWFFLARTLLGDEEYFARRVQWLLVSIIAGTVSVCVPAIINFATTHNPRQFATFYNPNLFANYCALALPLTIAATLMFWRAARRGQLRLAPPIVLVIATISFAIIALGLFVTSSKGGFLAAFAGLGVCALAIVKAKGGVVRKAFGQRKGAVVVAAVLVLIIGGVLFSKTILPRISTKLESDHSTMFRYYTWRGTLRMAAAHPLLGSGSGSFPSAYTQYAETGYTRSAHEQWLQIAAECGVPAMLLLLLACGASTLAGLRALKTENWIVASGALGAIAAFFIHGLTDSGWNIISIATLAMMVLALAEGARCAVRDASTEASNPKPRTSNLNWFWLIAALPLALGSWITQHAQQGEDLRTQSRAMMARGAMYDALKKAQLGFQNDWLSARLMYDLTQGYELNASTVLSEPKIVYERIIELQPTRALNYLYYAEYLARKGASNDPIARLYDKAIELDPNDTEIRLSRGKWKLSHNDQSGWQDIEYIAALKDKPYGKYPATPEMVDLNYARAYAMLAERDIAKNKKAAKLWIERGLQVIAEGRKYEPQRQEMEKATYGSVDTSREQTMNELEAQLHALQDKLRTR
jgi:O-antigen ligase